MRMSRPFPTSPRMNSPKQLKSVSSLELNSYKIDTTSLSEKAKQIQLLKTSLQSQISQYQASEQMFHQEIQQLSQQNYELKAQVKQLQTQLNSIKLQNTNSNSSKTKPINKNQQNQIKLLKITISSLEDEVKSLTDKLAQKNQEIEELSEYKKMYDIEVQNKNNIMNFYENKLAMFKRDKGVLISKYQQKISQLGSNLQINNATMIQLHQANNQPNNMNSSMNNLALTSRASTMPNGIIKKNSLTQYTTDKNISTRDVKDKDEQSPSTKNIKFIRSSKPSITLQQSKYEEKEKSQISHQQTPYKMFKPSSNKESRNKENTPYSSKSFKNQIHQISVSSSATGRDDMLFSRDTKAKQSSKKSLGGTAKTLRNDDAFLQLIKKISSNLRGQNIRSENLKNFGPVRTFISVASPLPSEVIQFLDKFPLGPTGMERLRLEQCIERMRKHLEKRYSSWSGSLLVELLIDKIEDVEIALEVNSEEDEIMAGLSSEDDNS